MAMNSIPFLEYNLSPELKVIKQSIYQIDYNVLKLNNLCKFDLIWPNFPQNHPSFVQNCSKNVLYSRIVVKYGFIYPCRLTNKTLSPRPGPGGFCFVYPEFNYTRILYKGIPLYWKIWVYGNGRGKENWKWERHFSKVQTFEKNNATHVSIGEALWFN